MTAIGVFTRATPQNCAGCAWKSDVPFHFRQAEPALRVMVHYFFFGAFFFFRFVGGFCPGGFLFPGGLGIVIRRSVLPIHTWLILNHRLNSRLLYTNARPLCQEKTYEALS